MSEDEKIFSIVREILEKGVALADTRIFQAETNIPESRKILTSPTDFYVTLEMLAGPSRVGHQDSRVIGDEPDEELENTFNTMMTSSISVYSIPGKASQAAATISTIRTAFYNETIKVFMKGIGIAYSSTQGVVRAGFKEDEFWIDRRVMDVIFLSTETDKEAVDIIDSTDPIPVTQA